MLNKKGMSHVQTAVIVLILAMALSVILSYASMMTILGMARDHTRLALDNYVTQNSILIYDSIKNGNNFTGELEKNMWKNEISRLFFLDIRENMLYATGEDGEIIYKMEFPNVEFEVKNTLKLKATYQINIPVTFAGRHFFDLTLPQKVTSTYTLK